MATKTKPPENEDPANLPAISESDMQDVGFPAGIKMAPGLALFMNDRIYKRCRAVSFDLSTAEAVMPGHLMGKPAAIFAVMSLSITWNLSPILVARCTYQTPGGGIGFMGVLVQAILENSGRIEGEVKFKLIGEWAKLRGRFKMVAGERGKKYAVQDWTTEEEVGLGVEVTAQVRGDREPLSETFYLNEFQPRHSTLWATRPWQQIRYTAVRAFANIACPGILMGLPFDVDPESFYGDPMPMQDVTPRSQTTQKNEFDRPADAKKAEPAPPAEKKAEPPAAKKAEKKAEPPKEPDPPPATTTTNDHLESEAEQADRAALQDKVNQAQPAPEEYQQAEQGDGGELKTWFSDMLDLVPALKTLEQAAELHEDVAPNLDDIMRAHWDETIGARFIGLMKDVLDDPEVKYVRDVTNRRQKYDAMFSGARLHQWKDLCDRKQTAILEALRAKKK